MLLRNMSLILHISPPTQNTVTRCIIKFNYDNIHNHVILFDPIRLQPDLRGETNQKTLRGQPVRTVFITQNPLLKIPKSPRNIIKIYKKEKFYHGTRNSFEVLRFLSNLSNGKVFFRQSVRIPSFKYLSY